MAPEDMVYHLYRENEAQSIRYFAARFMTRTFSVGDDCATAPGTSKELPFDSKINRHLHARPRWVLLGCIYWRYLTRHSLPTHSMIVPSLCRKTSTVAHVLVRQFYPWKTFLIFVPAGYAHTRCGGVPTPRSNMQTPKVRYFC